MTLASPHLADLFPFEPQIDIWGAAWWGDVAELTAMLVESPQFIQRPMWDRTKADLDSQVLISDDGVTRAPDSWALPYSWEWKRLCHRRTHGEGNGHG